MLSCHPRTAVAALKLLLSYTFLEAIDRLDQFVVVLIDNNFSAGLMKTMSCLIVMNSYGNKGTSRLCIAFCAS
jgi:hypothetical protein